MILLIIHRLRHPFGEDDNVATTMAASIVSDLELATNTTNKVPSFVTLPFIVAAMEATAPPKREYLLAGVEQYTDHLSPKARAMTKVFLQVLWQTRDRALPFRWIDVMSELPPLCVYL
jgi:hypothetical protein